MATFGMSRIPTELYRSPHTGFDNVACWVWSGGDVDYGDVVWNVSYGVMKYISCVNTKLI